MTDKSVPKPGFLNAFRYRSFRFQWPSDLLSSWGMEMESLILGWFVLVETDSAIALALIAALHYGGSLISPFFGVVADRVQRRSMLIVMRVVYAGLAGMIMVLALLDIVKPWHLFVIAGMSGLIKPSDLLVRNSLIADSVPVSDLRNAMGIARTTMDSARIIGALMGAGLLSWIGLGPAYGAVVGLYLGAALCSCGISVRRELPLERTRPWMDLKSGLSYIRGDRILAPTLLLAFFANLTAIPVSHGLLPVLAKDVYVTDENGLAALVAAFAVGALIGSLLMATTLGGSRPGRTMLVHLLGWHVLIIVMGQLEGLLSGLVMITLIGAAQSFAMIAMAVLLLSTAQEAYRGRVSGVRMLAVYGLPMGLLLGGVLIEWLGVPTTFTLYGAAGLVVVLIIALRWPEVMKC